MFFQFDCLCCACFSSLFTSSSSFFGCFVFGDHHIWSVFVTIKFLSCVFSYSGLFASIYLSVLVFVNVKLAFSHVFDISSLFRNSNEWTNVVWFGVFFVFLYSYFIPFAICFRWMLLIFFYFCFSFRFYFIFMSMFSLSVDAFGLYICFFELNFTNCRALCLKSRQKFVSVHNFCATHTDDDNNNVFIQFRFVFSFLSEWLGIHIFRFAWLWLLTFFPFFVFLFKCFFYFSLLFQLLCSVVFSFSSSFRLNIIKEIALNAFNNRGNHKMMMFSWFKFFSR